MCNVLNMVKQSIMRLFFKDDSFRIFCTTLLIVFSLLLLTWKRFTDIPSTSVFTAWSSTKKINYWSAMSIVKVSL